MEEIPIVYLRDTIAEDLPKFVTFESEQETKQFITPYPLEWHQQEFKKPEKIYKTIVTRDNDHLVGFVILILDEDERSVEFRRIVIGPKGKGYGQATVKLLDELCKSELKRNRIRLGVYDFNLKGQYIYEKAGYIFLKEQLLRGKILKIYEKDL